VGITLDKIFFNVSNNVRTEAMFFKRDSPSFDLHADGLLSRG